METTLSENPGGQREGRSARKHRALIEAATTLFLRSGYAGTSMDEIAASAGVSKQTAYKHFSDKESLFTAIVTATVKEIGDAVYAETLNLPDSGNLEADLRDLALRQLTLVMQPRIMQLRRLVIAEADRFPSLGRAFHDQGPGRTIGAMAETFGRLRDRRLLRFDDPLLAAAHFNWLVMSIPINNVMLLGERAMPKPAELDGFAGGGVRAFLAAYGAR